MIAVPDNVSGVKLSSWDIQRAWWQHASANPESWGFHSGVNFNCQDVLSNWSHQWPLCLFSKYCQFFGIWQVWISQPRSSTFWALILSFNNRWTSQSDLLHLGLNLFLSAISGTRFLVQWDLVLLHSWFVPLNIFMFYTFSSGCEVDASSPRLPILQFCIRDQPVTANTYSRSYCVKFTYCGKLFSLNHETIFCV